MSSKNVDVGVPKIFTSNSLHSAEKQWNWAKFKSLEFEKTMLIKPLIKKLIFQIIILVAPSDFFFIIMYHIFL